MKLYLIRHPETMRNEKNRLTGWEKTNYSQKGKMQFEKIISYFENINLPIYSSDLPRCLKLAKKIISKTHSKLIITELLRERNFKETKPKSSSENEAQFSRRVIKFLEKYDPQDAIIISHAGVKIELIKDLLSSKNLRKYIGSSRDTIFLIESNKKGKTIKKIKV